MRSKHFVIFLLYTCVVVTQEESSKTSEIPYTFPSKTTSNTTPTTTRPWTRPTTSTTSRLPTTAATLTTTTDYITTTTKHLTTSTSKQPTTSISTPTFTTPTSNMTTGVTQFTSPPTPKPTTPAHPATPPFPNNIGNWSVNATKEGPCIMLTAAIQLHINGWSNISNLIVDVPNNPKHVNVTGDCGILAEVIQLSWDSANKTFGLNTLSLKFVRVIENNYELFSVKYKFGDYEPVYIYGNFFETPLNQPFQCRSNQRLESELFGSSFYMLIQNAHLEAFRLDEQGPSYFSLAKYCELDAKGSSASASKVGSLIIGMSIGVGLAGIVGVILGIYMCRRYLKGGYQPLNNDTE